MKTVYCCNVNPNGAEQEPLGLPSMSFGEQAPSRPSSTAPSDKPVGDTTSTHSPQSGEQEPLGLPSMSFGDE